MCQQSMSRLKLLDGYSAGSRMQAESTQQLMQCMIVTSQLGHLDDLQDNTIADNPMVELLTSMQHMLEQARVRSVGVGGSQDLHQLVIIVADGRFHEKESLQRVVAVGHSMCI